MPIYTDKILTTKKERFPVLRPFTNGTNSLLNAKKHWIAGVLMSHASSRRLANKMINATLKPRQKKMLNSMVLHEKIVGASWPEKHTVIHLMYERDCTNVRFTPEISPSSIFLIQIYTAYERQGRYKSMGAFPKRTTTNSRTNCYLA